MKEWLLKGLALLKEHSAALAVLFACIAGGWAVFTHLKKRKDNTAQLHQTQAQTYKVTIIVSLIMDLPLKKWPNCLQSTQIH